MSIFNEKLGPPEETFDPRNNLQPGTRGRIEFTGQPPDVVSSVTPLNPSNNEKKSKKEVEIDELHTFLDSLGLESLFLELVEEDITGHFV